MNEEKKVPFKWEYGEETISLQLGMYANNQRLYIGMITHTEDGAEPFADMPLMKWESRSCPRSKSCRQSMRNCWKKRKRPMPSTGVPVRKCGSF